MKSFIPAVLFVLVTGHFCLADLILAFGDATTNIGATDYTFDFLVENSSTDDVIIDSFTFPFKLAPGFEFLSIDINSSEFDLSQLTVRPGLPLYDALVTANAIDATKASGQPLAGSATEILFSLQIRSDGSAVGDVDAVELLLPNSFGRLSLRSQGQGLGDAVESFASSSLSNTNPTGKLTAVPEPSPFLMFVVIFTGIGAYRWSCYQQEGRWSWRYL